VPLLEHARRGAQYCRRGVVEIGKHAVAIKVKLHRQNLPG
jgi:hypothetical protein